jgi:signal peptide peptidase SppA
MSNRFINVLTELYTEPWLIRPDVHEKLCDIVEAHIDGSAHEAAGIASLFGEPAEDMVEIVDNVGIISINGVLGKRVSLCQKSSGVVDVDDVQDKIMELIANDAVDGIVLDISSPGGTVTGTPELADFIKAAGDKKRIVAFTDTQMCSAAYWIGSQAYSIIATKSSSVGSIGVYLSILDQSRAAEMQGIKVDVVKGGKLKGIGIPGTSLSSEQREFLQDRVDFLHSQFKAAVQAGRGVDISESVMEGQDLFGEMAVKVRLIDMIGTMQDAIHLAANGE